MDPIKVQGVTDWPQPAKVKDVQSFIGFMNFYWRFIRNFSKIARPVTTGSPGDGIGPEASRLRLSHWAGPSVTGSAKLSQSFYRGIIIMILTKGKPVPLAWEFIYKLGEVTRVTSTILPDMGRKCVTEA